MKCFSRLLLAASLSAAMVLPGAAADKSNSPAPATYLMTNDDGVLHSYVSFFAPGTSQGANTLTFAFDVNTEGLGLGGGYFGGKRLGVLTNGSTQCVYASDAATGDIAGINIQTHTLAGNFMASQTDDGTANGISISVNNNYLYAGFADSNTIATFSVQPGCQLSFIGDTPVAGLQGGLVAGMAQHGSMLVVTYADGSIESFSIANGTPISNGDEQNSTSFSHNGINFPEGVDITADGHFAVFGDSSLNTVIEVSDVSSGHLTTTIPYVIGGGGANSVGPSFTSRTTGVNSGAIYISPDESMIFVSNSDGGSVSAAFFNATTGTISGGCTSQRLAGYYNPWAFAGSVVTRDNTGTGGVLYVAEYGYSGSYIGVVNININSNGLTCTLPESTASEVPDLLTSGLLTITTYPPRSF
jgi:hypothetical protein